MKIFRSLSRGFLLLSPVSLTELCSFWYGLKDLFTLHKLAKKGPGSARAVTGSSGANGLITKNKNHLKTKLSLSVVTMGNQYQSMSLIKGTVKWVCRDIIFVAQKLIQSNSIINHLNYSVNAKLCLPSSQSSVL